jgi:crossover junction endodeoxyribonuclease RuvC
MASLVTDSGNRKTQVFMKILGIDPGSRITGYGVIAKEGNRLVHIDNGAIITDAHKDFPTRLQRIYRDLTEVIERYRPDAMAVENIFFATNVQSALKLGQARGAAIVAGVNAGLPVFEYTALQVKQAVVGHGRAAKEQVQKMIKALLNLPEVAQEDASDALAVAVCHIHSVDMNVKIQAGRKGVK